MMYPYTTNLFFWEHEGNAAVRSGNFKLICEYYAGKQNKWALYDMAKDRSELVDLSTLMPEQVKIMQKEYEAWANRVGVVLSKRSKKLWLREKNSVGMI
ncbi:hypothetical protein ACFOG5_24815 [Pedobacter fastidiosus]|uniref:hypothetical protein n=1 Tax=Pedobacter fastidiosus TaxID=2765361 RepID=UPI00361EFED2